MFDEKDLRTLVTRIKENFDETGRRFSSTLRRVRWEGVAFGSHDAHSCKDMCMSLLSNTRKHRTLSELLDDAECQQWDGRVAKAALKKERRLFGFPKAPRSVYAAFFQQNLPQLNQEYPNDTWSQLHARCAVLFNNLSESELATRTLQYSKEMDSYWLRVDKFNRKNSHLLPPKPPNSALEHYKLSNPAKGSLDFRSLQEEGRAIYDKMAKDDATRYWNDVKAFRDRCPAWKPPLLVIRAQRKLENADKPKSAWQIFCSERRPYMEGTFIEIGLQLAYKFRKLTARKLQLYHFRSMELKMRYNGVDEDDYEIPKMSPFDVYVQDRMSKWSYAKLYSKKEARRKLKVEYRQLDTTMKRMYQDEAEYLSSREAYVKMMSKFRRKTQKSNKQLPNEAADNRGTDVSQGEISCLRKE